MDIHKSKFRFSEPYIEINEAFLGCMTVRVTTVETTTLVAPHLAGTLKDDLFNGFLIQNRSETTDAYAALLVYKLLTQYLQPAEDPYFEVQEESLEKEIEEVTPASTPPSIILEFEGKSWIQVKFYLDSGCAVVRGKDKWSSYTFDKFAQQSSHLALTISIDSTQPRRIIKQGWAGRFEGPVLARVAPARYR